MMNSEGALTSKGETNSCCTIEDESGLPKEHETAQLLLENCNVGTGKYLVFRARRIAGTKTA